MWPVPSLSNTWNPRINSSGVPAGLNPLGRFKMLVNVGKSTAALAHHTRTLRGSTRREARHLGLRRVLAERTQQVAEILTQNRA